MFIETLQKLGLSAQFANFTALVIETEDPTLMMFLVLSCGSVEPSQDPFNLMIELKSRLDNTPINEIKIRLFVPACRSEKLKGNV